MECHERYFMIAVDLSFTGEELRFEAVGKCETNKTLTSVLKALPNIPRLTSSRWKRCVSCH